MTSLPRSTGAVSARVVMLALTEMPPASTEGPRYVSRQGLLIDASGRALATGPQTLTFDIVDQASAGSLSWRLQVFQRATGTGQATPQALGARTRHPGSSRSSPVVAARLDRDAPVRFTPGVLNVDGATRAHALAARAVVDARRTEASYLGVLQRAWLPAGRCRRQRRSRSISGWEAG